MLIGIIGDTHFGFGWGTDRESESFENAREAFQKVLARRPDLIILTGDIFDSAIPRQEVLSRAAEILLLPRLDEKSAAKAEGAPSPLSIGIPLVAIHGTHERRPKGSVNPVKMLGDMGLLNYLHGNSISFSKGGEKVSIFGMGGVPEIYASDSLERAAPVPTKGAFNLFLFHQSVVPYVPGEGIAPAELPPGFDLYIDGHVHWGFFEQSAKILFTGSTLITQMRKNEQEKKKAWLLDTATGGIEPVPLDGLRDFVYDEIGVEGMSPEQAVSACDSRLSSILSGRKGRPLIRLVLKGNLKQGFLPADIDLSATLRAFSAQAIIKIDKEIDNSREQVFLSLEEKRKSVGETTVEALRQMLEKGNFPKEIEIESLYPLLVEGRVEEAHALILSGKGRAGSLRSWLDD